MTKNNDMPESDTSHWPSSEGATKRHTTLEETISGLIWLNVWRRGEDVHMPKPADITRWIDYAIEVLGEFQDHPDVKEMYK